MNKFFFSLFFLLINCAEYGQKTEFIRQIARGKELYNIHCSACHAEDGSGLEQLVPSLVGNKSLKGNWSQVVYLIRFGVSERNDLGSAVMPANQSLTEKDLHDLVNFLGNVWGNNTGLIPLDVVKVGLSFDQNK